MLAHLAIAGSLVATAVLATATPAGAGQTRHESSSNNWFVTRDDDSRLAYVLVKKEKTKNKSTHETRVEWYSTGSGETEDFEAAREARRRAGQDVLWVRLDDRRYLIRDHDTMAELEETLQPQELLGRQQGLLGKQQARLGQEQARLGREQSELGARQGRLGARNAELSARIARRVADGLSTAALDREMRNIASEQAEIGRLQQKLGEAQARLGEDQSQLGARQGELGAKQGALAREIDRKVETLIENAVAAGIAEPID